MIIYFNRNESGITALGTIFFGTGFALYTRYSLMNRKNGYLEDNNSDSKHYLLWIFTAYYQDDTPGYGVYANIKGMG